MRSSITAAAAVHITRAAVDYIRIALLCLSLAEILIDGSSRRSLGGMCC